MAFFGDILSVKARLRSRTAPAARRLPPRMKEGSLGPDASPLRPSPTPPLLSQGEAEMLEVPCSNCGKKSTFYRSKRQARLNPRLPQLFLPESSAQSLG